MLDVIFPTSFPFELTISPLIAIPSSTLIPQLKHVLSALLRAFFPMKFSLSKSINFPKPTEKGFVYFEKSWPADKRPASILWFSLLEP